MESTLPIRPSTPAWRAVIRAMYGSPLEADERDLFSELSGGREPPAGGSEEILVVAGRRAGKSETIARVALYEAIHGGHTVALAPGQIGLIPVISPLREQSGEIIRYLKGLAALPQVAPYVAGDTADSVTFRSRIRVQTMTADAVALSGPTVVTAIRDEFAKFPGAESVMPDTEIDNSLRPAMAPLEGAPPRRLIGITSAYIKDGVAYETDREHFGRDSDVLVVRGSSQLFNPSLSDAWLERQRRKDPVVFAREYLAEWQDSITDGWFGDILDSAIDRDVVKRPHSPGFRYVIAIDPAFNRDRFAVSVAHAEPRENGLPLLVQDFITTIKPRLRGPQAQVSSDDAAVKVAALCKTFETGLVYVDNHGGEPLHEVFGRRGVRLIDRPWTASNKAPTFQAIRDAMIDGRVRLLDVPDQIREFHAIQGELLRSGTERIQAAYGHDDMVTAAVMSLNEAAKFARSSTYRSGNSEAKREARSALRSQWDDHGAGIDGTGLDKMTMYPPRDSRRRSNGDDHL